jgi:hypothetical protein
VIVEENNWQKKSTAENGDTPKKTGGVMGSKWGA